MAKDPDTALANDKLVRRNMQGAAIRLRKVMQKLRLTYEQAKRLVEEK